MSELDFDTEAEAETEAEDEFDLGPPQPAGEVDVATLSKRHHAGEHGPVILEGYWVRLADNEDVPKESRGHIAVILSSPWKPVPYTNDGRETIHGYRFVKNELFRVQTRDAAADVLEVPHEAFSEIHESRAGLLSHA